MEERERKAAEEKKAAEERAQREANERQTREETERAEHAQASKEEAERKAKEAAAQCVVPSLTGDSLNDARKALHGAHCKLGRISTPRGSRGALVVTGQSLKRGVKRPGGTAVAVTLGSAARHRG